MLWRAIGSNQPRSCELHVKAPVSAQHETSKTMEAGLRVSDLVADIPSARRHLAKGVSAEDGEAAQAIRDLVDTVTVFRD
jgi:hypothetical protein